jgi:terminal uridylyltransferase
MHLGQLLRGFFEYYTFNFHWGRDVVSIRSMGGLMTKQEKRWVTAVTRPGRENSQVKDRYLFTVEDPFETAHNVGRTCTVPGVARMREEFRRAAKLIRFKDGGRTMTECLCVEAPPELPWIKREDRDNGGGHPSTAYHGGGASGESVRSYRNEGYIGEG